MAKKTIQCQCPSCKGTGLYSGFAEPAGTAVICQECDGKGPSTVTWVPY